MHKIFLTSAILISLLQTTAFTQGGLLLENSVYMGASGSVNIVIENGKWKNTSSIFSPASSTVKFTGTASSANSTIEGTTTFYHLEVAKNSNDLRLTAQTVTVNGKLYFTSGKIDLSSGTIGFNTGAILAGESGNSRTYSADVNGDCYTGISLNSPSNNEPANFGMRITASGDFGLTGISRRHNAIELPSGNNVLKHWRVLPTNSPGAQNATLRFYYFDAELNGLNENTLTIWRSSNFGASWVDMGFASRNTSANYVEQTGISSISGWWTLGAPTTANGPGDDRSEPLDASAIEMPWQINPNPVADQARVSIVAEQTETIRLELFDATGKTVLIHRRELMPGENQFALELQNLASGTYYARIAGRNAATIPIVKL